MYTRTRMVQAFCPTSNIHCNHSLVKRFFPKKGEKTKKLGSIDNSLGTKWQEETKGLWGDAKGFGEKVYKDWLNKKK